MYNSCSLHLKDFYHSTLHIFSRTVASETLDPIILCFTRGSSLSRLTMPLPGIGSALALLRWLVLVFGQPLATDILHHGVLCSLGSLKDVLDQRAGPAWLQLHRLQISRSQFAAQQVGLDLQTEGDRMRLSMSLLYTTFWGSVNIDHSPWAGQTTGQIRPMAFTKKKWRELVRDKTRMKLSPE